MSRARILYSERLGHTVHLGHIQDTPDHRDFRYEDIRGSLQKAGLLSVVSAAAVPTIPHVWGHGNDLAVYPMHGNGPDDSVFPGFQGAGDCEIARQQNAIINGSLNAGKPAPPLDGSTAIPVYSHLSGFNPQTGANDTGLATRPVYQFMQQTGITDKAGVIHKGGPYLFAEAGDWSKYCEMAYLFEEAGIAWNFTTQMMDQFDNGQPWQWVAGQTEEGGHITAGWGPYHTGSWMRNQAFTLLCYQRNCSEVSSFILMERYNAVTGETAEHYKDADLEKFIVMLAAQKTGQQPSQGVVPVASLLNMALSGAAPQEEVAHDPIPSDASAESLPPEPAATDPVPEPAQIDGSQDLEQEGAADLSTEEAAGVSAVESPAPENPVAPELQALAPDADVTVSYPTHEEEAHNPIEPEPIPADVAAALDAVDDGGTEPEQVPVEEPAPVDPAQ